MSSPELNLPGSPGGAARPLRVAVVNDYEIVVRGLADMLAPYADRVVVVELEAGGTASVRADVALFDTFGGRNSVISRIRIMVAEDIVDHVVVFTWDTPDQMLGAVRDLGVSGVLPKSLTAEQLVAALERICRSGARAAVEPLRRPRGTRSDGLTQREQEVLALLSLGMSNSEIGEELFLGVETVRTYVRQVYRKLGVRNRTEGALRAVELGLGPPPSRYEITSSMAGGS